MDYFLYRRQVSGKDRNLWIPSNSFSPPKGQRIVLRAVGEAALAKLRLLLKTQAKTAVFAPTPAPEITPGPMQTV